MAGHHCQLQHFKTFISDNFILIPIGFHISTLWFISVLPGNIINHENFTKDSGHFWKYGLNLALLISTAAVYTVQFSFVFVLFVVEVGSPVLHEQ